MENKSTSELRQPLVSVVVVNHDRAQLLQDCLESLSSQSYRRLEILVVDNGSVDTSRDLVAAYPDERVRLICLEANLGFGVGCNVGIREAEGEFVALLNNDAVASGNWIREMVLAMSEPSIGMCASKILFFDSDVIDKAGHLIYFDGQNRGRGTGDRDRGQFEELEETIFPDGCAALYRKALLEEVGGFDEAFFAYADDADVGLRARLLGWRCIYAPRAVVAHRHSSTTGSYSTQKIFWVERNRFWLAVKSFPAALLLANPLFTFYRWCWNVFAALTGQGAAGNFRADHSVPSLAWTIARAYGDGFRGLMMMLRKRRQVRGNRRLSDLDFYRLIWRFRISARVLAMKDRDELVD